MIKYTPLWETLQRQGKSTYTLIKDYHISSSLIDRLRHNKNIQTSTIDDLCKILNCKVEDIIEYVEDKEEN